MWSRLLPLLFAAVACAPEPSRALREGAAERDPNAPPAAGDGGGDGRDTGDTDGDTDGDPVTPADEEVCYAGPDGAWTTCLPLVSWEASWGPDYAYPDPLDGDPHYAAPLRFIDLEAADSVADPMLAANFALSELMQSWKGRFALYQPDTLAHLQAIRDQIGGPLTINSGYRNVSYNAGVGGATWSRHIYGDAADMAASGASLDELAALCADRGAGYIGMYETHVHCDWRDDTPEPAFYAASATLRRVGPHWEVAGAEGPEGRLRIAWSAEDAAGRELARHQGPTFVAPPAARSLRADLGGLRALRVRLDPGETPQ